MENVTNVTVNEVLQNVAYEAQKLSPYATNAMRPAIIQKSLSGRVRAIDADFASECGVTKERLDDWCYNVDTLYNTAVEYSRALGTDQEEARRQECWRVWKQIIRVGEGDIFHPNMFVREKDVENLRVLAAESCQEYVKGVGFIPTVRGKLQFRGIIEIRLALRIAGNAILNDTDKDILQSYQKAVKVIAQTKDLLLGYTDTKGNKIASIYDRIEEAEKDMEELVNTLKKQKGVNIDKLTKRHKAVIADLNSQMEAAEKRLQKNLQTEKELREDYSNIVKRLNKIEGTVEKKPENTAVSKKELREQLKAELEAFKEVEA